MVTGLMSLASVVALCSHVLLELIKHSPTLKHLARMLEGQQEDPPKQWTYKTNSNSSE